MNERQSQLLMMRYSGLSYKEIAGILGLSPTSIGPLLVRAEREFEECYRALAQLPVEPLFPVQGQMARRQWRGLTDIRR